MPAVLQRGAEQILVQFAHSTELVLITTVAAVRARLTPVAIGLAPGVAVGTLIVPQVRPELPLGAWLIRRIDAETFRRLCMSFDAWVVGFGLSTLLRALHIVEGPAAVPRHVDGDRDRRAAPLSVLLWTSTAGDLEIPCAGDQVMHMRLLDRPPAVAPGLDHLRALEAESIHILREVVAEFERPVMLYSIGKDSSVLLRLAQKAFHPGPIPFPLLHVDTTYKFREMIEFRDWYAAQVGARLIVHTNREAIADGTQPFAVGTQRCCGLLKTRALLDALDEGGFDAAFGGARRDEERSRAKERVFSIRDAKGQWDPKRQRPELWHILNSRIRSGESMRVFPLSNWTEIDVWQYIDAERIPVVPLYFAKDREVIVRGNSLIVPGAALRAAAAGRAPGAGHVPHAIARLLTVHRRGPIRRRYSAEDHRGVGRRPPLGAAAARHRSRPGRLDGDQEARGLLLMSDLLRICTAGSVDDGKSTLIGRLLYDSRGVYEDQVHSVRAASRTGRPGRSTSRSSPTASGPSASRASPSTSRIAISLRRGGSSSWPTRPGTNSTRATWRPARRRPTSRSSSSTRGTGCGRRRGGTHASRGCSASRLRPGNQQDGSRRVRRAESSRPSATISPRSWTAPRSSDSDQRAPRRQRDRAAATGRPGSTARACSSISRRWRSSATRTARPFRFPVQLVIRPDDDFRGYAGQIASGAVRVGRRDHRLALRPDIARQAHRHVGRRPRRRGRADVGHARRSTTRSTSAAATCSRIGASRGRPRFSAERGLDGRAAARSRTRRTC